MSFGRSLQPDSARPLLPSLMTLVFLRCHGIKPANPDIDDDFVLVCQLGLLLSLDVYVCMTDPGRGEIQIFVYTMPFRSIKLTARKYIERRAGGEGNICYNQARMMRRKGIVDCVGENAETVIEEEQEEKDCEGENSKLDARTNLRILCYREAHARSEGGIQFCGSWSGKLAEGRRSAILVLPNLLLHGRRFVRTSIVLALSTRYHQSSRPSLCDCS